MIQLFHLNKYFNRRRQNEIHVIDDTTLELPSTGLICFLGASGSGKTTLLNVIGGLDKASGKIIYDDITLKRYNMTKVDKMRRKNMGYIFQNYNLFPNMTVYDNLKFALSSAEIYDKEEVDKRINYCLNAVGMLNYKRRKAIALSGGQQQRVAIARALVKKTKVIIADEPTGNLDSNNTIEVMNIIKKISESCLVILVTHERKIASFYADRIIEIQDGKVVSDKINDNQEDLSHQEHRVVYLKDLENQEYDSDHLHVQYYFDSPVDQPVHLNVVYKNGSIIIDVNANTKVKYVGQGSEVILKEEHYRAIAKEDINQYQYDCSLFIEKKGKRTPFKKLWNDFKMAFSNFFYVKLRHKLLYVGFLAIGLVVAYTVASISDALYLDERTLYSQDPSALTVINPENATLDFDTWKTQGYIEEISYVSGLSYQLFMKFGTSYQTENEAAYTTVMNSIVPASIVDAENLKYGMMPEKKTEVAIDLWIAESFIKVSGKKVGITSLLELLGRELYLDGTFYEVTGIVERHSNIIVLSELGYLNFSLRLSGNVRIYDEDRGLVFSQGRAPVAPNEIVVNDNYGLPNSNIIELYGREYTIVGMFTLESNNGGGSWYISESGAHDFLQQQKTKAYEITVFSSNQEQTISYLNGLNLGLEIVNPNQKVYEEARNTKLRQSQSTIIFAEVLGAAVFVFIFFMFRSKMIDRIYTIGVYRALGASRSKVIGLFIMEIFVLTTFTTVIGYAIMTYLIYYVNSLMSGFATIFFFPWYFVVLGILVIYFLHFFFGLLPIFLLLRKTPSQILTKYDI